MALVALAALAGAIYACSRAFPRLRTNAAPKGIVSLQLAATPARAAEVVDSWRREGLLADARRNVRIDFLFLPLYATFLALLVSLAARAAIATRLVEPRRGETVGAAASFAMWGAGTADFTENLALLKVLGGRIDRVTVRVAFWAAAAKFALIVLGLLCSLLVLLASAIAARKQVRQIVA